MDLQKFLDSSTLVACVCEADEEENRGVENYYRWCEKNHLRLNIDKTRELVVDVRQSGKLPIPVTFQGEKIKMADSCRFLRVHINDLL